MMLTMFVKNYWLLCSTIISTASGSIIQFTADHADIETTTPSLTLHCGLTDNPSSASSSPASSVVGRRTAQTSADVPFVTSVLITKDEGTHVASVSQFLPANVVGDVNGTHVSGSVSGDGQSERAFLELTYDFPYQDHAGVFLCEVNAVDALGHIVTLTQSVKVNWVTPSIDQLAKDLRDLVVVVNEKDKDIKQLQHDLAAARQIEKGVLDCGSQNSNSWGSHDGGYRYVDVRATFSSTYASPPIVHLGVVEYEYWQPAAGSLASSFEVKLIAVDNQGFTMRYQTYTASSSYNIKPHRMSSSWLSIPQ